MYDLWIHIGFSNPLLCLQVNTPSFGHYLADISAVAHTQHHSGWPLFRSGEVIRLPSFVIAPIARAAL